MAASLDSGNLQPFCLEPRGAADNPMTHYAHSWIEVFRTCIGKQGQCERGGGGGTHEFDVISGPQHQRPSALAASSNFILNLALEMMWTMLLHT